MTLSSNRRSALAFVVCTLCATTGFAAQWYVSPIGTPSGNGSMALPWDLQTALNQPGGVLAGDTIWLRGGAYVGLFSSHLNGTPSAPIIVRQYPHERATLMGAVNNGLRETLHILGTYTWFWGFEVTAAGTDHVTTTTGSWPSDMDISAGVGTEDHPGGGVGCKLINLVVHDTSQGMSLWTPAENLEVAGCLLYHNGWDAPDRGHGHAIYTQNNTGTKLITDSIMFGGFSHGMHAYGSDTAYISNYTFQNNVSFDCGILSAVAGGRNVLIGGARPAQGIVACGNFVYRRDGNMSDGLRIGYGGTNPDANVQNNYVVGGTEIIRFSNVTFRNNTSVGPHTLMSLNTSGVSAVPAYNWNFNSYYCLEQVYAPFHREMAGAFSTGATWNAWRSATGYDANSTYTNAYPSVAHAFVRPNPYEPRRANIIVFNWPNSTSVNVDISSILSPGQTYGVRDAQNYFGPLVASGTYAGGTISIPMTSTAAAQPAGNAPKPYVHTSRQFGVFILADGADLNGPPVVSAGADTAAPFSDEPVPPPAVAALAGTISDDGLPVGAAVSGTWSKVSGPGTVSFTDANAAATTATFSTPGTYVLRLTATDTVFSAQDECIVTATANRAPAVDAGHNAAISLGNVAALDGTVSDEGLPAGSEVTQSWSVTSGPGPVTFGDAAAVDTTATFGVAGTYVLRLTASDGVLSAFDEVMVDVRAETNVLSLHLPLDEGAGTLAADVAGGRHGTLFNGAAWITGHAGTAAHFDEVDDYLLLDDLAYPPQFSISFWFKPDDNLGSGYQYIYSHGTVETSNSVNILLAEAGDVEVGGKLRTLLLDADDGAPSFALDYTWPVDGQWHLYTLTVSTSGGARVYLDGALMGQEARGGGAFDPNTKLYLGGRNDLNPNRFTGGGLDDVRIYQSALSDQQVHALFAASPGDANGDGKVNGLDFLLWQQNYPTTSGATLQMGDFNGDGKVDGADFLIWQANYKPL